MKSKVLYFPRDVEVRITPKSVVTEIGRYPYIMVRHGHNLYFCGATCKHKYEEAEEK